MKYLPYYKEFIKTGRMSKSGLCKIFPKDDFLELFTPTDCVVNNWHWGSGYDIGSPEHNEIFVFTFTPMRQNILLFMAAMNGEL